MASENTHSSFHLASKVFLKQKAFVEQPRFFTAAISGVVNFPFPSLPAFSNRPFSKRQIWESDILAACSVGREGARPPPKVLLPRKKSPIPFPSLSGRITPKNCLDTFGQFWRKGEERSNWAEKRRRVRYRSGKEERKGKGLYLQFPLSFVDRNPSRQEIRNCLSESPLFPPSNFVISTRFPSSSIQVLKSGGVRPEMTQRRGFPGHHCSYRSTKATHIYP